MRKKIIFVITSIVIIAITALIILYFKWKSGDFTPEEQTLDTTSANIITSNQKLGNICKYAGDTYYYYDAGTENGTVHGVYALNADGTNDLIYECVNIDCIEADEDTICVGQNSRIVIINLSTGERKRVRTEFAPYDIKLDSGNMFASGNKDAYKLNTETNEMEEILIDEDMATGVFDASIVESFFGYVFSDEDNAYVYSDDKYYYIGVAMASNQQSNSETLRIDKVNVFRKDTGEKVIGRAFEHLYNGKVVGLYENGVDFIDINTFDFNSVWFDDSSFCINLEQYLDDKIVFSCLKDSGFVFYNIKNIEASAIKILSLEDYSWTDIELKSDDYVIGLKDDYALIYNWNEQKYYSYNYVTDERTFIKYNEIIKTDTNDSYEYYVYSCGNKVFIYNSECCLLDIIDIY